MSMLSWDDTSDGDGANLSADIEKPSPTPYSHGNTEEWTKEDAEAYDMIPEYTGPIYPHDAYWYLAWVQITPVAFALLKWLIGRFTHSVYEETASATADTSDSDSDHGKGWVHKIRKRWGCSTWKTMGKNFHVGQAIFYAPWIVLNFEDVRFREPFFSYFYLATQVARTMVVFLGWAPTTLMLLHAIENVESWWRWVNFASYAAVYAYSLYSVLEYNDEMNAWYDQRLIQVSRGYVDWYNDRSGWVQDHMEEIMEEREEGWEPDSDDEDLHSVFPGVRYDPDNRAGPKREVVNPIDSAVDPISDEVAAQGDDGERQTREAADDFL